MLLQLLQLRVVLPDGLHLALRAIAKWPPLVITHEGWGSFRDELLSIVTS